jgi:hypothetical protein
VGSLGSRSALDLCPVRWLLTVAIFFVDHDGHILNRATG